VATPWVGATLKLPAMEDGVSSISKRSAKVSTGVLKVYLPHMWSQTSPAAGVMTSGLIVRERVRKPHLK
jgi:hypothetical protein